MMWDTNLELASKGVGYGSQVGEGVVELEFK